MGVSMNGTGDSTGPGTSGLSPQGLVIDPVTQRLYVHNYMGRSVSIFNIAPILDLSATSMAAPTVVTLVPVADDKLNVGPVNKTVLRGKQVFYNSSDLRMSRLNYISCAGCHLDGAADMRVWDFTNRGEGLRNTVVLQGRGGTAHGNVHWSANFDEIQDFDNDAYFHFHAGNPVSPPGAAFSSFTESPNPPMAAANKDRSDDLDAMANYVASLTKVSRSPFRNADGTLTAQGAAGEAVFKARNCQRCHTGSRFTDSTVGNLAPAVDPVGPVALNTPILHNVGTIKTTSGQRLGGGALPGVDTPTLKGVWQSPPYLHDGSAATLADVFNVVGVEATKHLGGVLTAQEQADLARYMIEIDEIDAPPVPPGQVNTVAITSVSTGRPYSLATPAAGRYPFVDRSYQITGGSFLVDDILLRTSEDDKAVSDPNHVVLTFANPGLTWKVFVCYDGRQTSLPSWLSGWNPSGETITVTHMPSGVTVLEHDVLAPGTLTLGGNRATGAAGALRNYFVLIREMGSPPTFEEGPLSQNEWVHDHDADGDGLLDEFEAVTAANVPGLSPWVADSAVTGESDEDQVVGSRTLFVLLQTFGKGGGGGGSGGGSCGLSGFEFLLPLVAFRLLRRRRV
jgi:mono/diheme cytochrome c family protein